MKKLIKSLLKSRVGNLILWEAIEEGLRALQKRTGFGANYYGVIQVLIGIAQKEQADLINGKDFEPLLK